MSRQTTIWAQQSAAPSKAVDGLLQCKGACGTHTVGGAEYDACRDDRQKSKRPAFNQAEAPNTHSDTQTPRRYALGFAHDFSRVPVYSKAPVSLQTKLKVNIPGDVYEEEADRVAERVTSTHELQSGCGCAACRNQWVTHPPVQTAPMQTNDSGALTAPPIVHEVLRSPGQPMDTPTREFMESRFGHDFSRIRIHADDRAAESAVAVKANAYTVGRDIVFGPGRYAPASVQGRRLLAHELTHTIQQSMVSATSALSGGGGGAIQGAWLQRQDDPGQKSGGSKSKQSSKGKIGDALKNVLKSKRDELKSKLYAKRTFMYTVQPGDNLSKIALKFLGDGAKADEIYEENREVIGDNPEHIRPGMKLVIHSPVAVTSAKGAEFSALDPKGGLMHVKGEALEYLKEHETTRKMRRNFEKYLRTKVIGHLKSDSYGSGFADVYREDSVSAYGGDKYKPEDWLSTGTWLIGHTYPEVRYTVHWAGDSETGWKAHWEGVWVINDNLDLAGGKGHGDLYNKLSGPLQHLWNDMLGGRENTPLQAKWKDGGTVDIPPTSPQTAPAQSTIPMSPEPLAADKTAVATPGAVLAIQDEIKNKPWVKGGAWNIGGALGAWELKDAKAFYKSQASKYTQTQVNRIRAKLGLPKGGIDDKFLQAVALYQRNAGLRGDGKVGPETLAKMFGKRSLPLNT